MDSSDDIQNPIRLFIALKIEASEDVLSKINALQKNLKHCRINWVSPTNFHLTLKFLGDVQHFFLNALKMQLENVSRKSSSFELMWLNAGYFGNRKQPRVLWYSFSEAPELLALQKAIETELKELGFERSEKQFRPHLTIARIKTCTERDLDAILMGAKPMPHRFMVTNFSLIQSRLTPKGAQYTTLEEFKLGSH